MIQLVNVFSIKKECLIRDFAQLIGSLVACCPGVEYGEGHIKLFEIAKNQALIQTQGNFDKKMIIPEELQVDFNWWKDKLSLSVRKIRDLSIYIEIFSDASMTGWGAFCNNESTHGFWNETEKGLHINHLELLAAFYALRCYAAELRDKEILLRIDNTTALSYINKMGGTHVKSLNAFKVKS